MTALHSTVRRYYCYRVTTAIGFFLPVSVLFLTEARGFTLDEVGVVMAAYLLAMLVAEIPTGYVGDRLGRRATLAVGNGLAALSLAAWAFLRTPLEFALVHAVWATGTAFRSGTADAWLYEFLTSRDRSGEYARIAGRARTARLAVSAAAALTAGVLASVDWTLPFLANAGLAAAGLPVLATLPAVEGDEREDTAFGMRDALRTLRLQATRPAVRWFVAYAALFYGLSQLVFAFEQPALRAVGVPVAGLGVLYAGFKLVSAGAASTAGALQERLGTSGVYALYAPVVGVAFAAVAFVPVAVVPVLFLTRGASAATRPIRNQYLNDRLGDVGRATALSGASMVLSLVAAVADLVGGVVATRVGPVAFLAGAGIAAAGAGGVLWLAVSPVRAVDGPPVPTRGSAPGD